MQTAISINSCYRRAVRHATWWIYNVCEGQGGDRQEKEVGQSIHIQVPDQVDKTPANYNHIISQWCYCLRLYCADMSSEGMQQKDLPQFPSGFSMRNIHFPQLDLPSLFFFFFFLGSHLGTWSFPGQGSNRSCSPWPTPQPHQCGI